MEKHTIANGPVAGSTAADAALTGLEAACRVLECVFGVVCERGNTAVLAFAPLPPHDKGRPRMTPVDATFTSALELAGEFVKRRVDERLHLFFTCGAFKAKARTKKDAVGSAGLWADVDAKAFAGSNDAEKKAAALAAIRAFPLAPTWVTDTGHGYHPVWLLSEFHPTPNRDAVDEFGRTLKGITVALAGTAVTALDSTNDVSRMLRLAGSQNWKDPDAPVQTQLLDFTPKRRYRFGDFARFADATPRSPKSRSAPAEGAAVAARGVTREGLPTHLAWVEKHRKLGPLLLGQGKTEGDTSPSGYDFSLLVTALLAGVVSDVDLAAVLCQRLRLSERAAKAERSDYVERTIANAKAAALKMVWQSIDPLLHIETIEIAQPEDDPDSTRWTVYGKAGWKFDTTLDVLRSAGAFATAVANRTMRIPERPTRDTWDSAVKWAVEMQATRTVVPRGHGEFGALLEAVQDWLLRAQAWTLPPSDVASDEDQLHIEPAWPHKQADETVVFKMTALQEFLASRLGATRFTHGDLVRAVRTLGCQYSQRRIAGKRHWVWWVKPDASRSTGSSQGATGVNQS